MSERIMVVKPVEEMTGIFLPSVFRPPALYGRFFPCFLHKAVTHSRRHSDFFVLHSQQRVSGLFRAKRARDR